MGKTAEEKMALIFSVGILRRCDLWPPLKQWKENQWHLKREEKEHEPDTR
jgi:hypothetical protein